MAQVSAKQPSADEVMSVGNKALQSGVLEEQQTKLVQGGMHDLNERWNTLNIDVIEKELRFDFCPFFLQSNGFGVVVTFISGRVNRMVIASMF